MNQRKDTPPTRHAAKPPTARRAGEPHRTGVAQPKMAEPQAKKPPAAPPAYRPQPTPKVLQTKSAHVAARPAPPRPATPNVPRPRALPPAARPAAEAARTSRPTLRNEPPVPTVARPVLQRKAAQPSRSAVIQATKVYPNLHPGAVERVEPGQLFRLESFTDQYRLRKADSHGVYVPNQQYNFVRTVEGQMLLHNRYRHPSIAEGRQVLYAGEVHFNNGKLEWWSNGSGHYQPDSEDAQQAALPMDHFYTYQQVIKGEHKRGKR